MSKILALLFVSLSLEASCILRDVINYSDRAELILPLFLPVRGSSAVPGGARVAAKLKNQTDPRIVKFNQATGNQMTIKVVEENELGKICKEYSLNIDELTGKMDFSKKESCTPGFGGDNFMSAQLPDRCYIDLEMRGDVNGLSLRVLQKDEVTLILQEEQEIARKTMIKKQQEEKLMDQDELSPT